MDAPSQSLLTDVRKVAVLRPNAIGDFVFALPALHALRHAFPYAEIVYIGHQWHADFLAGRPGPIDRVVVIPPCPGVGAPPDADVDTGALRSFIQDMGQERFDLVLQVYGGGRYSNPLAMEFGARLTVGMRAVGAAPLDRWVHFGPLQNRRLQLLEVAALAGANTLRVGRELEVTDRDRKEAESVLPPEAGKPLALIQPGASDPRRRWPAERFSAVADILAKEGALVAVHGTAAEAPLVGSVIEAMSQPAVDLSGKVSLSGLCGLLERAALMVSNDTGPLHLALAIGTPCVGIYWFGNLIESGPLRQEGHRAAVSARVDCPVCGAENLIARCPHDVSFVDEVTVREVADLAIALLRRE